MEAHKARGTPSGDAGLDGGEGTGDAGVLPDAGTCRIGDGGLVAAGTWLSLLYGSCIICDPSLNPDGWTVLDDGQVCEQVVSAQQSGPAISSISGVCQSGHCASIGGRCEGQDLPCYGGFCGDGGYCELDQNLGWLTQCWNGYTHPNMCADGPCCFDAGVEGVPNGGGWCCGLIDGGVQTCLPARAVCYATLDCCEGLTCTGHDAVFDSDAGYGFCE